MSIYFNNYIILNYYYLVSTTIITSTVTITALLTVGRWYRDEALGNEFRLYLARVARLCLFQQLAAAHTLASARFEFAHVFAVALDLFLLGVGAAAKQFRVAADNRSYCAAARSKGDRDKGLIICTQKRK